MVMMMSLKHSSESTADEVKADLGRLVKYVNRNTKSIKSALQTAGDMLELQDKELRSNNKRIFVLTCAVIAQALYLIFML